MPRFRERWEDHPDEGNAGISPDRVRRLVTEALRSVHFFVNPAIRLDREHREAEEISWEIFHGRLLDPAQTTRRQTFEAWNLYLVDPDGRSADPVLAVRWDAGAGLLHVTRAVWSYAWEAYDHGTNVIRSRETRKWVPELVGTISLARFGRTRDFRDELVCRLFQAVVGCSRLPLTSVEAPLPAFSLGRLAYFYRQAAPDSGPMESPQDLVQRALTDDLSWQEQAKLLEILLRASPPEDIARAADWFMARWRTLRRTNKVKPRNPYQGEVAKTLAPDQQADYGKRQDLVALLLTLFQGTSLTPYTDLVDNLLEFLRVLESRGQLDAEDVAEFHSSLLRQLARHLTAYDLVTFHHRGANYPDALLLDAVLKDYLRLADRFPALFLDVAGDSQKGRLRKRLRRRALRQGWLLRRRYEGHLVPDAPTSPGENARVLPPPHVRVPEEQILHPHRRTRRLFQDDPLDAHLGSRARGVLERSIEDLAHPREVRELGMAIFLDRPLGAGKTSLEPDQTLLFSYLAFSRSIAGRRLKALREEMGLIPDAALYETYRTTLEKTKVNGIPSEAVVGGAVPGKVSLADACKVAEDFLFLRTTFPTAVEFYQLYSFQRLLQRLSLNDLSGSAPILLVRADLERGQPGCGLALYDDQLRKRLELDFDPRLGYTSRGGVEYPVSPLRVWRVWEETGVPDSLREQDLSGDPMLLTPRP
jgi:hypothetical protein